MFIGIQIIEYLLFVMYYTVYVHIFALDNKYTETITELLILFSVNCMHIYPSKSTHDILLIPLVVPIIIHLLLIFLTFE